MLHSTIVFANDPLIEHCEFEPARVVAHYLPLFTDKSIGNEQALPVLDIVVDKLGQPFAKSYLSKPDSKQALEAMDTAYSYLMFSPAKACGKNIEGFFRFIPRAHFNLLSVDGKDATDQQVLTQIPYPLFRVEEEIFRYLKDLNYASEIDSFQFKLSVSAEGEVTKIVGQDRVSRKNEAFVGKIIFRENNRFQPAKVGDQSVPFEVLMTIQSSEMSIANKLDAAVFAKVEADAERVTAPKRPDGMTYEVPKVFRVLVNVSSSGYVTQVQFYDELKTPESLSIINAMRHWYFPPETEIQDEALNLRSYFLTFSFDNETEEGVLLDKRDASTILKFPKPIKQAAPSYPRKALRGGIEGTVWVRAVVGKDGRVVASEASPISNSLFVESALKAVNRWRFKPGTIDGEPVRMIIRIPIPFKLGR